MVFVGKVSMTKVRKLWFLSLQHIQYFLPRFSLKLKFSFRPSTDLLAVPHGSIQVPLLNFLSQFLPLLGFTSRFDTDHVSLGSVSDPLIMCVGVEQDLIPDLILVSCFGSVRGCLLIDVLGICST